MRVGDFVEGRFQILREVASGGMGRIFLASDRHSDVQVAIKIVRGDDPRATDRFIRECAVLAEINHPGVVRYVAHGKTRQDELYLAMEWLEGEDLSHYLTRWRTLDPTALLTGLGAGGEARLRELLTRTADLQSYQPFARTSADELDATQSAPRGLSAAAVVALGRRVASALAELHRRGIVHRDIKPSNLFLPQGRLELIKLLDFGTARLAMSQNKLTATGALVGTPTHMAPEQVQDSGTISPATDIWSLGCVLYEALTLEKPFRASQLVVLFAKILMEEARPLRELRPDVPAELAQLIHRMLAKKAAARPCDAEALLAEFEKLEIAESATASFTPGIEHVQPAKLVAQQAEQRLVCILLFEPSESNSASVEFAPASRQRVEEILALFNAQHSWLMNGALVVTLSELHDAVDLATHAARCALALSREVPAVRIALTTGQGRVGAGLPLGETIERAVAILRRAKELNESAERDISSGRIWVDPLSARLLERRFTLHRRDGENVLVGELWADIARPLLGKPTPCVGRDAEAGGLELRWQTCVQESEAQVVLITAPAGMGKSRLRHELLRRLRADTTEMTVLEGRAEFLNSGSSYYAVSQMLRRHCEVPEGGPLQSRVAKMSEHLGRHLRAPERSRIVAFMAELGQAPLPDEADPALRAARQDPKEMREALRRNFVTWLRAEAAAAPVLLLLEDLHWADPQTIELFNYALEELGDAACLVLAFARPEVHSLFPKLWHRHRVHEVVLKGLSRKASERLIQQVLGNESGAVAAELSQRLWEHSGGNALFLEELIRAVAEGQQIDQADTVLVMLQARFGRLSAIARQVLRAASVFGRSFSRSGLGAVLGAVIEPPDIESGLAELAVCEVIEKHADVPLGETFGFRHALVREAAYALLSLDERSFSHALAGKHLIAAGSTDLLEIAEHLERGGAWPEALLHYRQAAERSLSTGDFAGTLSITERALRCEASGEQLGHLRALQGRAHELTLNEMAMDRAFLEAIELLPPGSVLYCQCISRVIWRAVVRGDHATADRSARAFVSAAPANDAMAAYMEALGVTLYNAATAFRMDLAQMFHARGDSLIEAHRGQTIPPLWYFAKSQYLRMVKPDPWLQLNAARDMHSYYKDTGQTTLESVAENFFGEAQGELGDFSGGEATLRGSLRRAEEAKRGYLIVHGQLHLAALLVTTSDRSRQEEAAQLSRVVLATDGVSSGYRGWAHLLLAQALGALGEHVEAELEAGRALALCTAAPLRRLQAMTTLISALSAQQRDSEARQQAEQALEALRALGSGGIAEIPLRLAVATALSAVGEEAAAREQLVAAARQIEERAAVIPDSAARTRYLTNIHQHVRVHELLARCCSL